MLTSDVVAFSSMSNPSFVTASVFLLELTFSHLSIPVAIPKNTTYGINPNRLWNPLQFLSVFSR